MDGPTRSHRYPPPNAAALGRGRPPAGEPPLPRPAVAHYLGVDPGVTGALALLSIDGDGQHSVTVTPTPVLWLRIGSSRRRRYEIAPLLETLRALPPIALACLEEQHARPGQGVTSTFATGYGAGLWTACLVACGISFVLAQPRRWRKLVGLPEAPDTKSRKLAVRLAACRRFPGLELKLEHADAVMLAVAASLERTT